jgi:CHAT domain-containing protein
MSYLQSNHIASVMKTIQLNDNSTIQRFFIFLIYSLWLLLSLLWGNSPVFATTATDLFEQGQSKLKLGQFDAAIHNWRQALTLNNLTFSLRMELLITLGRAYQELGLSQQAIEILKKAEKELEHHQKQQPNNDLSIQQVQLFTSLSDVYLATRQDLMARHYANKSQTSLVKTMPPSLQAMVLNNEGNVLTVEAYYTKAITWYAQAIALAQQAHHFALANRALINQAYAYFQNQQPAETIEVLQQAQHQLKSLDNNYEKAFGLISIGAWAQDFQDYASNREEFENYSLLTSQQIADLDALAYQTLQTALEIAKKINNSRLISYAYGYLGHLYEKRQRYFEALSLTRQAIFYAKQDNYSFFNQQAQGSEILYRWQWQLGRLFKLENQIDQAIAAYQRAVKTLQPIRQELITGYRKTSYSFRERLGTIYFELADLFLQRATTKTNKRAWLLQAIDTVELLKESELQDYFQDECVTRSANQTTNQTTFLQPRQEKSAIIYPLLLSDRTIILLNLPDGSIQPYEIDIAFSQLKEQVNEFRFELESLESDSFLPYSQRLYQWLIEPLAGALAKAQIDTLVIVPDGILRTIPFAALYQQNQFLIQQYAIATIPGLSLTFSTAPSVEKRKILINGLSQGVQGYPPLSGVLEETKEISTLYHKNVNLLLDQDFTIDNFTRSVTNTFYSIIHIASHGHFDFDPQQTFLLTYQGKLTVNQLEGLIGLSERRQEPLELLTLSACQTAVGDDQAALGLAGIALKAGAQSALATLWLVNDKASAGLVSEFYRQFEQKGLSKAKALQAAQKQLLNSYHYSHPTYWAPFLLIGNWH